MDAARLDQKVIDMRARYNEMILKRKKKEEKVSELEDQLREIEKEQSASESASTLAENSVVSRQIRDLENRLDKAMIKHNEAQSIHNTYKQIKDRLKEERLQFDNQLQAIEQTLAAKETDYNELKLMCQDAKQAMKVAEEELKRFRTVVEEERKMREKQLDERKQIVKTKYEMSERMLQRQQQREEKAANEAQMEAEHDEQMQQKTAKNVVESIAPGVNQDERESRIMNYEQAFRKIQEATGVEDVNEVIQKFLTQEDTHNQLVTLKQEAQQKIDSLNDEKTTMKAKLEEIKYSTTGSLQSRRVVDDFEGYLSESNKKLKENREKYERVAKVLINVKAGVEHLSDKLHFVKIDQPPVPLQDDTVAEVLHQCQSKLVKLNDTVLEAQDAGYNNEMVDSADQGNNMETELSQYNVRIVLPGQTGDDDDSDEDDDYLDDTSDVIDRDAMKQAAYSVAKELDKKGKKKKGKKGKQ
eukprot:TRINITY_DN1697_c0_g1_i1.p1 TRINITY_DN1697_c0_g1~~TRINITY_DN1697_c0_g1_i1.p1  ORF type:complete len:471 (-),score=211.43 TRINITY_DN1697_c0_g1_i1:9-1421(-)